MTYTTTATFYHHVKTQRAFSAAALLLHLRYIFSRQLCTFTNYLLAYLQNITTKNTNDT